MSSNKKRRELNRARTAHESALVTQSSNNSMDLIVARLVNKSLRDQNKRMKAIINEFLRMGLVGECEFLTDAENIVNEEI